MAGILYIISAPSGSGKSTLVNELRRTVSNLEFSISYTTRAPRGSEQDGHEYHFVTREVFEEMVRRDKFLEHATVFGHYYGTGRHLQEDAARRGNDLLLDIDVQGAAQVKTRHPQAVSIFVLPPSRQILEKRLRSRSQSEGVVNDEVISRRLRAAQVEIANYPNYDYILVNDRLDESVDNLEAIILSERKNSAGGVMTQEDRRLLELADHCRQLNQAASGKLDQILASFSSDVRG